jgi:hypothetical protein
LPLVWARLLYFAPDGKFPSFDVTDSGPWWDRLPAYVETGISFFLKIKGVTDSGPWWDRLTAYVETGISFFLKIKKDPKYLEIRWDRPTA